MARITFNHKKETADKTLSVIGGYPDGVTEAGISEASAIERKTVNNYLRDLQRDGRIHKAGLRWYRDDVELDEIEAQLHHAITRLFDYLRKH